MSLQSFLLILTGVLLNAVAQLALKASVRDHGAIELGGGALPAAVQVAGEPALWLGLFCYGVSVIVWILALSRGRREHRLPDAVDRLHRQRLRRLGVVWRGADADAAAGYRHHRRSVCSSSPGAEHVALHPPDHRRRGARRDPRGARLGLARERPARCWPSSRRCRTTSAAACRCASSTRRPAPSRRPCSPATSVPATR